MLDFESLKLERAGLPDLETFNARDGEALSFRFYKTTGNAKDLILLLHGSSYHGTYLNSLAKALQGKGNVCVPNLRGHHMSGRYRGHCSYPGQLEDDLSDLIKHLGYDHAIFVGHSSGGGLAVRFSDGLYSSQVQKLILLAPAIPRTASIRNESSGAC